VREGKAIYRDLMKRARKIRKRVSDVAERAELNVEEYKKRLAERIKELTGGQEIDSGRLEMEVAIYAKNCDISEELTRLKNHISNFEKTCAADGEAGKKLDFIAQELHREANTVGSKASDYRISKDIIDIKTEIEKIREQVKNVE
jgi:uncharacterized protein (TIGR00255 family)